MVKLEAWTNDQLRSGRPAKSPSAVTSAAAHWALAAGAASVGMPCPASVIQRSRAVLQGEREMMAGVQARRDASHGYLTTGAEGRTSMLPGDAQKHLH